MTIGLAIILTLSPVPATEEAVALNPQGACCLCDDVLRECRFLSDELCDGLGGVFMGGQTCEGKGVCDDACKGVPVCLQSFTVE